MHRIQFLNAVRPLAKMTKGMPNSSQTEISVCFPLFPDLRLEFLGTHWNCYLSSWLTEVDLTTPNF